MLRAWSVQRHVSNQGRPWILIPKFVASIQKNKVTAGFDDVILELSVKDFPRAVIHWNRRRARKVPVRPVLDLLMGQARYWLRNKAGLERFASSANGIQRSTTGDHGMSKNSTELKFEAPMTATKICAWRTVSRSTITGTVSPA
jgi:hypothetical protein